jgi:allophanate hydrolase subunit 1
MDVLVKGIPEEIGEAQVKEWVAILVERFENNKVNQIKEVKQAVTTAQTNIDSFRAANALQAKFAKEEVKAEPIGE